ncbi:pyridoxal-phosphate dependent enzyme [Candidatus Sumerlaeota bacterium]|nr:pyridoxal-phosphate dependent enzyme [Candidatus Sumerlaeota bacterium]
MGCSQIQDLLLTTPITKLNYHCENHLYIKRDDLLPYSFGGNKLRIALELLADFRIKQCDCFVSYGSSCSNLNRVVANICRTEGIPCYVVSSVADSECSVSNNSILVEALGATIVTCAKDNVRATVRGLLNQLTAQGYKPYYIYGNEDGNGNESVLVRAYEKVFDEILSQEKALRIEFDYVCHASGTGMTQSGLLLGKLKYKSRKHIVGLSIARNQANGTAAICRYLNSSLSVTGDVRCALLFEDKYVCGGYGQYDSRVVQTIRDVFEKNGIPMDLTYTGKGFCGMIQYLSENQIKNKNVLFIHTGGTPLFFNSLQTVFGGKVSQ